MTQLKFPRNFLPSSQTSASIGIAINRPSLGKMDAEIPLKTHARVPNTARSRYRRRGETRETDIRRSIIFHKLEFTIDKSARSRGWNGVRSSNIYEVPGLDIDRVINWLIRWTYRIRGYTLIRFSFCRPCSCRCSDLPTLSRSPKRHNPLSILLAGGSFDTTGRMTVPGTITLTSGDFADARLRRDIHAR